jgi:hypothetical protein
MGTRTCHQRIHSKTQQERTLTAAMPSCTRSAFSLYSCTVFITYTARSAFSLIVPSHTILKGAPSRHRRELRVLPCVQREEGAEAAGGGGQGGGGQVACSWWCRGGSRRSRRSAEEPQFLCRESRQGRCSRRRWQQQQWRRELRQHATLRVVRAGDPPLWTERHWQDHVC